MKALENVSERHVRTRLCSAKPDNNNEIGAAVDSPLRVLLFTDLVGSTALNVKIGDERFVRLWAEHSRMVLSATLGHKGHRFHNTGDGFGVWFRHARDAVACAFEIHRRLQRSNLSNPDAPMAVRIGLAAGHPLAHGSDLYGLAVVRAARVCALAAAGETLAASEVLSIEPLRHVGTDFTTRVLLKGFCEPTTVFALNPSAALDTC